MQGYSHMFHLLDLWCNYSTLKHISLLKSFNENNNYNFLPKIIFWTILDDRWTSIEVIYMALEISFPRLQNGQFKCSSWSLFEKIISCQIFLWNWLLNDYKLYQNIYQTWKNYEFLVLCN
jgi:hypothetical protein